MFSSPIMYAWIAWLLVVGIIAVLRFAAHQREERQRAERRQQRRTGQAAGSAPDQALVVRRPRTIERRSISAGYRDQLVAAGIIRPATEPDIAPDPTIGSNPAISM